MNPYESNQIGSVTDDRVRSAVTYFSERMAHDLNNILTPLVAYPDIIATLLTDEQGRKMVAAMQESVSQALTLTQRLATMAGADEGNAQTIDLAAIAGDAVNEIRRQLGAVEGLDLQLALQKPCEIAFQKEAFLQALEAVLENAIRVVCANGGGTVTVGGERLQLEGQTGAGGAHIPPGDYQALWVADTGPGMPPEDLQMAIEPFRKGVWMSPGSGAGLGLSLAYCCLRRNGAYLAMESQEKTGTKVTMFFPVRDAGPSAKTSWDEAATSNTNGGPQQTDVQLDLSSAVGQAPPQETAEPAGNAPTTAKKRVLVVDDESSIVNLFEMILENFIEGIQVDKAGNGAEALDLFKQVGHEVLVMDLHMPILDGQATYYEIQKFCNRTSTPMPSVVFCTGYAPCATLRQAVEEDRRHMLLNKPVQSDVLVKAVRERLRLSA